MQFDHTAIHRSKYLERVKKEEEIEKCKNEIYNQILQIKQYTTMKDIDISVCLILELVKNPIDKKILYEYGLQLVDSINNNQLVMTRFDNNDQVLLCLQVQKNVKTILNLCGVDDNIEIQYDMDCSNDEEIARQLVFSDPEPVPVPVRRRRGRPRRGQT